MTKNNLKELSYYLFFGLMIFAKGIGLDSGDKAYYILSAAAFVCVVCKLVLTKYNKKQIAAMILLCLIAFVSYRNSGRMGILLSVLAIVGMKDMKVSRLFSLGTVVYGLSFTATVMAAAAGLIDNPFVVHEKGGIGEVIRWGMGYSTGNVFHVSYFILVVLLCYTWGRNYHVKRLLGLMIGNVLVFLFSLSYTGVAVTTFYLLLNLYAVKRTRPSKAEKFFYQLPLPLCVLFSFIAPLLLRYPVVQKLDSMLQARLSFSQYFLFNQPITLFGTRMHNVPNFWIIMDNGYVYFLMTFGVVAFTLLCVGYIAVIAKYSGISLIKRAHRNGEGYNYAAENSAIRLPELAIIFSFLLYGIMEQFLSNAFMNLSLMFIGEILFGEVKGEKSFNCVTDWFRSSMNEIRDHKRHLITGGCLAGAAGLVCYLLYAPVPEYIEVPLKLLNYVDAQSAMVSIDNEEGTKDALKIEMDRYKTILEDESLLERALEAVSLTDKLTSEDVEAALEFSLPQSVQNSGNYNTFRIRLLELYYDVDEAQYQNILRTLIAEASVQEDIRGEYGDVYEERIGKSSGEDRIEHISSEKVYFVEKSGDIAKIEYCRNGILSMLTGSVAGLILIVIIVLIRYNRGKQMKIGMTSHENSD